MNCFLSSQDLSLDTVSAPETKSPAGDSSRKACPQRFNKQCGFGPERAAAPLFKLARLSRKPSALSMTGRIPSETNVFDKSLFGFEIGGMLCKTFVRFCGMLRKRATAT